MCDTVIQIRDAAGTSLAFNDDAFGFGVCSVLTFTIGAGATVYVQVLHYFDAGTGAYFLDVDFP